MELMVLFKRGIYLSLVALLLVSCEQSEAEFNAREGNELEFAGRTWWIKHGAVLMGPGGNYFSNHPNDVWVDKDGFLHLRIRERGSDWVSTEVVSREVMGYGTYIFTVQADLRNIDPNVILGLFTWDNHTFQEQANSEVDIEFAKWGEEDEENTLQYGVQPIFFGPYYEERVNKPGNDGNNWVGISTHGFTWTDTLITWESYIGENYGVGEPVASWRFDLNNPARVKEEGGRSSNPIIIPAPGDSTNARMNLWLLEGPSGPLNQLPYEVIIRNFEYYPL